MVNNHTDTPLSASQADTNLDTMLRASRRALGTRPWKIAMKGMKGKVFHETKGQKRHQDNQRAERADGHHISAPRIEGFLTLSGAATKPRRSPSVNIAFASGVQPRNRVRQDQRPKTFSILTLVCFKHAESTDLNEFPIQKDMTEDRTDRTVLVPKHKYGFVIGQPEPDDRDHESTSSRETNEELGIPEGIGEIKYVDRVEIGSHTVIGYLRIVPFDTQTRPGDEIWINPVTGQPEQFRRTKAQIRTQFIDTDTLLYPHRAIFESAEIKGLI